MSSTDETRRDVPLPPAPPPKGGPPKGLLIGIGIAVLIIVATVAFILGRRGAGPSQVGGTETPVAGASDSQTGASVQLPPAPETPGQMEVASEVAHPAIWVDVYSPAKVREALVGNPWLQEQLQSPLGKGFVGGWAAFLGSTGEDLGTEALQGKVFDSVVGQMLGAPFRVVWFSQENPAGTPAIIVAAPSDSGKAAYEALGKVARRNSMKAATCPGGNTEGMPEGGFEISRWLIAEQALWTGRRGERMVFARHPAVVLEGLCADEASLKPGAAPQGVDLEVAFASARLGREAMDLGHVLGLGPDVRMQFAVEGTRLVGRGLAGALQEARLDSAALSEELLKLVPEDTPVLLTLQLKLPETLTPDTLKGFWSNTYKGPTRTRPVALLWTPRGDSNLPSEVALLWGRAEDAEALGQMFSGPNVLERATLCNHQVLASSADVLGRVRKACEGKSPNMLNAAGPVVQGLRAPGSVAFGVNTGRLLGLLLTDGYWSEQRASAGKPLQRTAPPEIEAARRNLETLPYIGLRGTVQGDSLVPGGFGS
jgi:hypothetical protein